MPKAVRTVPITRVILDEEIYPRGGVYPKRVTMFVENITDGFEIDPIEVQVHLEDGNKYRILDDAHRLQVYKEIGATELPVHIITPDDIDWSGSPPLCGEKGHRTPSIKRRRGQKYRQTSIPKRSPFDFL